VFANSVEVTKARGEYVAPSLGRVTVGELGPAWLARKEGHMKPSGYRSYESAWRVHVEPRWRGARVAEIRYTAVQAWITELSKDLSGSRVITVHSVLAAILDDAVRDRLLAVNPARGVKMPRKAKRPNVYLSAVQLYRLAGESGRYGSLVLLLGTVGLRVGEAAALRVSDVDFCGAGSRCMRTPWLSGAAPTSAPSRAAVAARWRYRRSWSRSCPRRVRARIAVT
jgi:hypothetical protein